MCEVFVCMSTLNVNMFIKVMCECVYMDVYAYVIILKCIVCVNVCSEYVITFMCQYMNMFMCE